MIHLRRRKTLYISVLALAITAVAGFLIYRYLPSIQNKQMSEEKFVELATQMDEMEMYMTIAGPTKVVFDEEAAKRDGYSEDIIQLTNEMITFQNQMLESTPSAKIDQDMKQFPLLEEYFDAATRYNQNKK